MGRLLAAFLLTLMLVAVFAAIGGRGAVSYVSGFVVLGYLLWRAWPAVAQDLAVMSRRLGRREDGSASSGR